MVDKRSSLWLEQSDQINSLTNGTYQTLGQAETVIYQQRKNCEHNPLKYSERLHQSTPYGAVAYQPWSLPEHQNTSNQDENRNQNWENSSSNMLEKNVTNGLINGTFTWGGHH